jgi:hypothetical protein
MDGATSYDAFWMYWGADSRLLFSGWAWVARIVIDDFKLTDQALTHAAWHGIGLDQIFSVLDHFWIVTPNRGDRAASHILFGTDDQGQCLAIPISRTDDPVVWRPMTAWYCKKREAAILRQRKPQ